MEIETASINKTTAPYMPMPEQIEAECRLIRAGWSWNEELLRRNGYIAEDNVDRKGNDRRSKRRNDLQ